MIYTVACTKGGAGKSTIATNLAVAAVIQQGVGSVALVDTDIQKTSFYWCEKRAEKSSLPEIRCVGVTGRDTYTKILDLGREFKTVIVDAGGRASAELQLAIAAADRVLVPVQPSAADGMAVEDTVAALDRVLKDTGQLAEVFAFLSRAPTNPRDKDVESMMKFLGRVPQFRLVQERTSDRKAYRQGLKQGRGVMELGPAAEKAAEELNSLFLAVSAPIAAAGAATTKKVSHG
jgi:chromosome partitioning protein